VGDIGTPVTFSTVLSDEDSVLTVLGGALVFQRNN
jgi:hypothetical protein